VTRVHFRWDRRPSRPAADGLRRLLAATLRRLGAPASEVHVLITGDDELHRLNSGEVLLGEIVVSLDSARRQAEELGHDEVRELEELVLHGVLHLLGHDHARDGGEMDLLELELREELLP
jgi:rRNA maturation RNase YbeY